MLQAGVKALINAKPSKETQVMVCYDNEEVGSSTKQGADSQLLSNILERITGCFGGDRQDFFRALSKSFLISADVAHAVHPNYSDKHDPTNRPVLNRGPVIKISASQRYTSDSDGSSVYEQVCSKAQVPVQKFVNRSDMVGGSTIGPISSTHLDIRSVDMGTPLLAMHSIRELGGVMDHYYVTKSFEEFYNL
jgi:aspartyl aminopeptidase